MTTITRIAIVYCYLPFSSWQYMRQNQTMVPISFEYITLNSYVSKHEASKNIQQNADQNVQNYTLRVFMVIPL